MAILPRFKVELTFDATKTTGFKLTPVAVNGQACMLVDTAIRALNPSAQVEALPSIHEEEELPPQVVTLHETD